MTGDGRGSDEGEPGGSVTDERVLSVAGVDTFYDASQVLHEVSLHADAGEVVSVLGRNGAGKTTLVRSILGLTPPRRGRIRLLGEDVTGEPPEAIANRGVGYVPQNRRLFPEMTVVENLEMGVGTDSFRPERLEHVYELFPRLRDRSAQRAGTLSGGEGQMLAIGRALVRDPELLVMDEPTEGLMPSLVSEIGTVLADVADAGYPTLLVDLNVDLALSVSDRVYLLDRGRIVHEAPADELRADPEPIERHLGVGLRD